MIKIETGVPAPLDVKTVRIALDNMQVGDSFIVKNATAKERLMLRREMKKYTNTFTSRVDGAGMRVWRIE